MPTPGRPFERFCLLYFVPPQDLSVVSDFGHRCWVARTTRHRTCVIVYDQSAFSFGCTQISLARSEIPLKPVRTAFRMLSLPRQSVPRPNKINQGCALSLPRLATLARLSPPIAILPAPPMGYSRVPDHQSLQRTSPHPPDLLDLHRPRLDRGDPTGSLPKGYSS
jgi:hypothetical protein